MRNKVQLSLILSLLLFGVQAKFTKLIAQTVDFTYSGVCVGSPTTFVGTITGATATTWKWSFGDGTFANSQNTSNTYTGSGVYTVKLVVNTTLGASDSITKFVTIQDLPTAFFYFDTPTCNNDSVQFHDLSHTVNGFIQRWVWNFGDNLPNDTVYFPEDPNVAHLFPTFGTFNITLQVLNSDGCVHQWSNPVLVIPSPIANFYFSGKCEDQLVFFEDASFANGAGNVIAYSWDFDDPISGVNNISDLKKPSHLFELPGSYFVKYKVTNFNNCSDTIVKEVVINPHPLVDFTFTSACLNELVYFDPDTNITNVPAIKTWFWDFGDGLTSNAAHTAHRYIAPGTYTVTLTITDTTDCENTIFKNITIHQLPVAHFNAGLDNCAGASVYFENNSTTNFGYVVKWEYNFGDGNFLTVNHPDNPNIYHTYTFAGTYNVVLTIKASDSCTDIEIQTITIHPNPVANFDFTLACLGSAVDFSDISQPNGGGSIVQWQWNFGDPGSGILNFSSLPTPTHIYNTVGNDSVQLIVTTGNGCSDTITRVVVVKPLPPLNFTSTNNCQNNAVVFVPDAVVMSPGTIQTWFWEFGDGITSPLPNPTHIYNTAGNYTVTLTVVDTAGCTNSITKPITIIPQPNANFTFSQPACKDSEVTFNNLSLAPWGYIVKCVWNFGDGNIQTVTTLANVVHTYTNYGNFNVSLTITTNDSCTRTKILPIEILPNPLANFSYLTSCVNSPVQFNDLSQQGAGGMASWSWNFGDPPSGANNTSLIPEPVHTFTTPGTYQVSLLVFNTGGCQDTVIKPVIVHALPGVDFTTSSGCVNDSTHFVSAGFVNPLAVTTRTWDFGDGFTAVDVIDPYHIYTATGLYIVTLTVTDTAGCENVKTHPVAIVPPPTSFFSVSTQKCASNPVFFTNLSTTAGGTFTSYHWEFGDGIDTLINAPANGNISHIYTVAGSFTVKLTVHTSFGCEMPSQQTFTISASPLALFDFGNTCSGAAVSFSDLSQPNTGTTLVNWLWNFGDPTSGINNTSNLQNPLHIYNTAGIYTVLLLVENASGCPDTVSKTVTVHPKPTLEFAWASTCLGTTTAFTTNTTITNVAAVTSYDWDFGDGTAHNTSQQNPVHTYSVTGNYTVTLQIIDTAGCVNSVSHIISISPKPNAQFSITSACLGATTHFTDLSFTSSGEPITGWHWDFGVTTATNDTSNLQNPVWIFTSIGVYDVNLIVTSQNGCQDTTIVSLQVFGNPTASYNFTAAPCNTGAVYFQDSSYSQQATIIGWNWEFEPNHFSTLQNPVYVFYAVDSCYDVRLIVTDVRGCVDTTSKQVCVPAQFDFTFVHSPTCFRDSTDFTPQLLAPSTDSLVFFEWNFGETNSGINNTSALKYPKHYYSQPGTYSVSLQSIDINNCIKTVHKDVIVLPLPVPAFSFTEGKCDSTVYFNESSSGSGSPISSWVWDYGDGNVNTVLAPASPDLPHKYLAAGMYVVGLTVTNSNGCVNFIADSNLLVKPCMNAQISVIDTLICQNNTLTFADSSFSGLPATEWYWDFGDDTDTTYFAAANPINHIFTTPGSYTVKMRISTDISGQKVSDSTIMNVVVNPTPLPDFTNNVVCYKQTAVFTNMTSGNGTLISDFAWNFGEPAIPLTDTSTMRNPSHIYGAPGSYDVQLSAVNTLGCKDSIQKTLVVFGLPDANYLYTLSCAGNNTKFTDMSVLSVAPLVDWKWEFSDTTGLLGKRDIQNPDFVFNIPGNYLVNLMVTDTNGCYDTINQHIKTWNVPTSIYSYVDNFNDVQGQLQFTNISLEGAKYYWTFGNGEDSYTQNPVAFYLNDGTYDITLVTWNEKECTDTLTVQYTFMVKGLYIPTAFSPNNPKQSVRLLKPVGVNLSDYKFEVYDRWGNMLWWSDKLDESGRPSEGWDGTYNGVLMQEGTYVWKASAIFKDHTIWDANSIGNAEKLATTKVGTATMMK